MHRRRPVSWPVPASARRFRQFGEIDLSRAPGAVLCSIVVLAATPLTYTAKLDAAATPVLAGRHIGTFPQAVRLFGKPDRLGPVAALCLASWRRFGLEIHFHTTGACTSGDLRAWSQVTMRALRWHTKLGLHVGDAEAKLNSLYPDARSLRFLGLGDLRELETGGPLCDGGPPLALAARIVSGKVGALLAVHVPACG
jgi:hypothetical protein